jgi:outer membrane receptor protein involved in Fe transport
LNAGLFLTDKSQIRLAYFKSVNRPEFRELAPFAYYDFTFNNVLIGNPNLKTPSIHNMDVRWELYPSTGETFSIGVFQKFFSNPIEMFFVPGSGSGGTRNFTFDNADAASSTGLELEWKRSFRRDLGEKAPVGFDKFLKQTGFNFNVSAIFSKVTLGDEAVGQDGSRPMTGQSPYMINAGLFHNNLEHGLQVSLMYNVVGKRIFAVGTYGTPDIYLMPRNSVDLTLSKAIGERVEIKLGIQDLLSEDEAYQQDSNEDGKITSLDEDVYRIRRGTYVSAGVSIKL